MLEFSFCFYTEGDLPLRHTSANLRYAFVKTGILPAHERTVLHHLPRTRRINDTTEILKKLLALTLAAFHKMLRFLLEPRFRSIMPPAARHAEVVRCVRLWWMPLLAERKESNKCQFLYTL